MRSRFMKFKLLASVCFVCILHYLPIQASQNDSNSDSYEQDYEYDEKEVSVSSSMISELIQMFTYETHAYKGIEYGSLYENYEQQVMTIINNAVSQSQLEEDEQYYSDAYTVIGEAQEWDYEPLYDRLEARDNLKLLIANFINSREAEVRSRCVGVVLQEHASRVVWAPGCCDLQIHKNCFVQCKDKGLAKCMNPFCAHPDWNKAFYAQVIKSRRSVRVEDLYDRDCPLCMEPLKKVNVKKNSESSIGSKKGLIINKDGITPGAKKIRFL